MPRALELSGDGGPDAMCPTCQSILAWKLAHDGLEKQLVLAEVGSKCSSVSKHPSFGG